LHVISQKISYADTEVQFIVSDEIKLVETVFVPGICAKKVTVSTNLVNSRLALLEPKPVYHLGEKVCIPYIYSLVDNGKMKIWITNFSCESVVLSEDTGLGACMEVTEANLFSLNSEINGNEIETMSLQSPVSLPCNVKLGMLINKKLC